MGIYAGRCGLCSEKIVECCLGIADGAQSAKDRRHGTASSCMRLNGLDWRIISFSGGYHRRDVPLLGVTADVVLLIMVSLFRAHFRALFLRLG